MPATRCVSYLDKVGQPLDELTFAPDEDGIIPVLDGEWFEDDIVARTREFLRATFGEATLRENIRFIEESLGKDLRKYFLTTFTRTTSARDVQEAAHLLAGPEPAERLQRPPLSAPLHAGHDEHRAEPLPARVPGKAAQPARPTHSGHAATHQRARQNRRPQGSGQAHKMLHECEEWERETILPLAQRASSLISMTA